MLYYNFKDYAEFKELFGIQKHGNGTKSRKNKILLAHLKSAHLLKDARQTGDYSLVRVRSISELKQKVMDRLSESSQHSPDLGYRVELLGRVFGSSTYETDEFQGICEDRDFRSVRYVNHSQGGKIYKMKTGKLLRNIAMQTQFGRELSPQVLNYIVEEFNADWQSHSMEVLPDNRLVVDDDFQRIYDSSHCLGDFNSCMTDKYHHSFYEDSVDASAAYLENDEGMIIARCIIFNKVYDELGNIYRLAERQYSSDGSDMLKRILIGELIKGSLIDGYKSIGAGCSDSREFVDVDGGSLSHKRLYIDCSLDYEQTLSYQDSFKWLNMGQGRAYNYRSSDYDEMLDVTEGELEGTSNEYDSYHDDYCSEITMVYCEGGLFTCDSQRLDDFEMIDSRYYHRGDISTCPHCEERFVTDSGYYSEITESHYCCDSCLCEGESADEESREEVSR